MLERKWKFNEPILVRENLPLRIVIPVSVIYIYIYQ